MYSKTLALTLALTAAVSASPLHRRQNACQDTYKTCIASGVPEVACQCDLTACVGEDAQRIREWCASATASIVRSSTASSTPVATSIPGGCNPAHPGSCPDSYFSTTVTAKQSPPTSISGIPGGCNPAHPGSCPDSYFSTTITTKQTPTPCPSSATQSTPTSIPGIPGGCNPAHPGSCPDSYFSTTAASAPSATSAAAAPGSSNPVKTDKTWKIQNLTRYCSEDNSGCDYNFSLSHDGKTEKCTVIRMPGSNAAQESWDSQPCTAGSAVKVSWGYAKEPAPAFAVVSVVDGKEIAWFGVADVNGQKVSPSNPFGSGQWGELSSPVYMYN